MEEIIKKEKQRLEEFCKFNGFTMGDIYTKEGGDRTNPEKMYVYAQITLLRSIEMQLANKQNALP